MPHIYHVGEENVLLERFEIKPPDYELINRENLPVLDEFYESKRYQKKGGIWFSKQSPKDKILIMFAGDITCFGGQFEEAWDGESFDFNYEFDEIRPIFSQADLVVGNLETMVFPCAPYRSEKHVAEQNYHCNAPLEFLSAVRDAGYDVVTNANNHDLDTGALGIGETIDNIEKYGLIQTGTFKSAKKRFELIDVCGYKIAIVAFATEHNNKLCNLTEEGAEFLLNNYSKEKAEQIFSEAHELGADVVFACIHWGQEHKIVQNKFQEDIAASLARIGYDCIIGSHPHVLQPFTYLDAKGKRVPVFYSMGNFVSHNSGNAKSRSIIACIELSRSKENIDLACSYIPIYTSGIYKKKKYVVIPILDETKHRRNSEIKSVISKIVGCDIKINTSIEFTDVVEEITPRDIADKPSKIDLSKVKNYPITFIRGRLTYEIFKNHARITHLDDGATSISITENVLGIPITEVEEEACAGNSTLTKINFNRNIKYISNGMFKGCRRLEGFRLGVNIVEIGDRAFENCSCLSAAVMRKNVAKIGSRSFKNCPNLVNVKLPMNVKEIADDAFDGSDKIHIYCEKDSYAEGYAIRKRIKHTIMKLE